MKKRKIIALIAITIIALFSCKKNPETLTGSNKIEIGTTVVDSVAYYDAKVSTTISSTGGNQISQHGHCWNIENEPTIEDNHTSLGKLENPKTFQSQIEELSPNTTYFIRSYCNYQNGTVYGNQETITTLKTDKPVIITSAVTDITLVSAVCGGTVVNDGGFVVTARGVCWDTINDFSIDSCLNKTINGDSIGTFTSNITELTDGMDYFVKAYATNEKGTGYGEIKTFSTIPLSLPEVQTSNISGITTNSAVCGGDVLSNGNGTVTARGICWSNTENVSLENYDGLTENGTGTGSFISNITNLTEGTFYYVVAYAINEKGTGYGQIKSFQTIAIGAPTVITSNVTDITTNSAQCGGNVTNSGNGTVTARGVCWNTAGNPTLQNCIDFTENGSGLGAFNSSLTGLNEGTIYYINAYATNEVATAYGAVKSFATLEITMPVVTTSQVTNITSNSAQCGGNVTSSGNGTVTARGVCWNTTGNPSLTNCDDFTTDGSGMGSYVSYLTDLYENTLYYVTAYAKNEEGTAYGDIESFTTIQTFTCGDQITYSGQNYYTVLIGTQCWFKENLNIGTRIDGENEQTNNGTIEKYCYDDDENNCDEYGGLYQWDEMMEYTIGQGNQGICPVGWHLPTDDEWKVLEGTVDSQYPVGDPEWDGIGDRGFDAGYNLKSETGWYNNGNGSDAYGFSALPGGMRGSSGYFYDIEERAKFWSSGSGNYYYYRRLNSSSDEVYRYYYINDYGLSVRCLKD